MEQACNQQDQFLDRYEKVEITMPTPFGEFRLLAINDNEPNCTVVLYMGDLSQAKAPLVRLHSECLTGDVFGSRRCDCGEQLHAAMEMIAAEGTGAILYLRQEGRGIGLFNKMKAYALQEQGHDTVDANLLLGLPADGRDYKTAAGVLQSLGVRKLRLITNNPLKMQALDQFGVEVASRVSIEAKPCSHNSDYLSTKKERMGHMLSLFAK